jgi:hypothetical protein
MEKRPGIIGLTGAFKEAVADLPDGSKIVFTGSVAVCTPFAELLAYAVKDRSFEIVFLPRAEMGQARHMRWREGLGFCVADELADPCAPDAIVILGGLAMPKFGVPVSQVRDLLTTLARGKRAKVIGVCFMSILQRSGWHKELPFDAIIDATMESTIETGPSLQP